MLHTISHSNVDVELINTNDIVIFWQNGVTLALNNSPTLMQILTKTPSCFALENDVLARGLGPLIDNRVTIIEMNKIVELTATHHRQMKW